MLNFSYVQCNPSKGFLTITFDTEVTGQIFSIHMKYHKIPDFLYKYEWNQKLSSCGFLRKTRLLYFETDRMLKINYKLSFKFDENRHFSLFLTSIIKYIGFSHSWKDWPIDDSQKLLKIILFLCLCCQITYQMKD